MTSLTTVHCQRPKYASSTFDIGTSRRVRLYDRWSALPQGAWSVCSLWEIICPASGAAQPALPQPRRFVAKLSSTSSSHRCPPASGRASGPSEVHRGGGRSTPLPRVCAGAPHGPDTPMQFATVRDRSNCASSGSIVQPTTSSRFDKRTVLSTQCRVVPLAVRPVGPNISGLCSLIDRPSHRFEATGVPGASCLSRSPHPAWLVPAPHDAQPTPSTISAASTTR